MVSVDLLGFIAAFCTTVSFAPQVIKVLKTGDTESLSLSMYLFFTFGVLMWLVYGIQRGDIAVTLANAFTLILASIILVTKIRNDYAARTRQTEGLQAG